MGVFSNAIIVPSIGLDAGNVRVGSLAGMMNLNDSFERRKC